MPEVIIYKGFAYLKMIENRSLQGKAIHLTCQN